MAGEGKTTLAKKVYDDQAIISSFHHISFVRVSQRHTWRKVLQEIINTGATSDEEKDTDVKMLEKKLRSTLQDKRFLIVLDDVLHSDLLDDLVQILGDNRKPSRIIVTSRFKIVSEPHKPRLYQLTPLSDEQSRELLSEGVRMAPQKSDLAPLFKGPPLSILAYSPNLQSRLCRRETESFDKLNSCLWENSRWKESLALCYEDLHSYLKPCFLYIGVFPVDREIHARHLTRLWLAEGFVEAKDSPTLEETAAEYYLKELVKKNLIQVSKTRCDGAIKSFRIHVAVHAFCKSKFEEEFPTFKMISSPYSSSSPLRRLSINIDRDDPLSRNEIKAKSLRSFLNFSKHDSKLSAKLWESIYDGFPILTVLDLGNIKIETFPQIKKLLLLRYLRFKCANAACLPEYICKLSNLQTLEVTGPPAYPLKDIWDMRELRHLYYKPGPLSLAPKSGGNYLNNLQTLVSLAPESCLDGIMSKMPNLTLLAIVGDLVKHGDRVFGGGLNSLCHLRTLKLEHLSEEPMKILPIEINFPPSLDKLVLSKTRLTEDPMEKLKQIPNLRVLKLARDAYMGGELNCESHSFPQLQSLALKKLSIKMFKMSMESMPCLNNLIIKACWSLQGLPLAALKQVDLQKLELQCLTPGSAVENHAKELKDEKGQLELRIVSGI